MDNKEIQKEKIRHRYKGVNPEEIIMIPAIQEDNIFEDSKEKRVAVYVRVSTDDPRQTSSYELQKNHYSDVIDRHKNWKLVKIYADEGISGTSLNHRQAFSSMINDCCENKIDLIVTKSVSRFARNIVDCIGYVRKLKELQPPVGILFEAENIYTLDSNSDMALAYIALHAQEESHNKSEIMNASIEMRFRRGIFLTPPLLGYDLNDDGELVINEKEASIVRLIFFMYLYGYTCRQIAETLTKLGCKTKKNNTTWSPGSILQILQNERHCGAVYARKTWTPNYLDHRSRKNKQNRNQYQSLAHHDAIISRDDFIAVQHFINNAKYGNKRILPKLKVINKGVLAGFVTIHLHWAGFKVNDYINASESAYYNDTFLADKNEIEIHDGEFDFRGYEIARSQFFNTAGKAFLTISNKSLQFSSGCVNKLNGIQYVELLIMPQKKLLAVRPCEKNADNCVKWTKYNAASVVPKSISGIAFLPTVYEMMDWNLSWKYRIQGVCYNYDNAPVIIFNMKDVEILMSGENVEKELSKDFNALAVTGKSVIGYPTEWIQDFGYGFYTHAQEKEIENFTKSGVWNADDAGETFSEGEALNVTDKEEADKNINQLIDKIMRDNTNG